MSCLCGLQDTSMLFLVHIYPIKIQIIRAQKRTLTSSCSLFLPCNTEQSFCMLLKQISSIILFNLGSWFKIKISVYIIICKISLTSTLPWGCSVYLHLGLLYFYCFIFLWTFRYQVSGCTKLYSNSFKNGFISFSLMKTTLL